MTSVPYDDCTPPPSDDAGWGSIPKSLRRQLTANEIAVYIALSWRCQNLTCWCRHKVLADDAGMSVSTVQRALDSLRAKGVVTWAPRFGPDGQVMCNTYTLLIGAFGGPLTQVGGSVTQTGGVGHRDRQKKNP